MASVYGYITLGNLENYTGIDYSAIDAVAFTDVKIEKKITDAERLINAYLGVSTAQTKTDSIIICTMLISAKICHDAIMALGYHEGIEHMQDDLLNMTIPKILDFFLNNEVGVDSIPMSGANRFYSNRRWV